MFDKCLIVSWFFLALNLLAELSLGAGGSLPLNLQVLDLESGLTLGFTHDLLQTSEEAFLNFPLDPVHHSLESGLPAAHLPVFNLFDK